MQASKIFIEILNNSCILKKNMVIEKKLYRVFNTDVYVKYLSLCVSIFEECMLLLIFCLSNFTAQFSPYPLM